MAQSVRMAKDGILDHSPLLLTEGYLFIRNRCDKLQTDVFESHLLGQKVICMSSWEAVDLFYDREKFQRRGAAPKRIQKTLFGAKGVQTLDGPAHTQRKQLFMSLMTPRQLSRLAELTKRQWISSTTQWAGKPAIILFDEVQELLCKTACTWADVPLMAEEAGRRADEMGKMVDAFGAIGPRHWQGRLARRRSEQWMEGIVQDIRRRIQAPATDSAAQTIAAARDLQGHILDAKIAAVELLNIIRPITAIATYITFAALAIHEYPNCLDKLRTADDRYLNNFCQEVRRYYPFTPFVGARVRETFTWHGLSFKQGTLVLLDIYGINHDPRLWKDPQSFRPERFAEQAGTSTLIPQGGGDPNQGHRCAGEQVTLTVLKASIEFLINHLDYDVPTQDLTVNLKRIPTLPKSRFRIQNVNRTL